MPDGEDVGCAGKCNLLSAEWSTKCALNGNSVSLIIKGNDDCAGKSMQISLWEEDNKNKDATFSLNNNPQSPVNFEGKQTSISWTVERESSPDDEAEEDMEYMFTATIGGRRAITATPLVVKYCTADDSDCDGEPDDSDECPDTPLCVEMYEEAAGCSVEQAKIYTDTYKVPGLGFNALSFILAILVLSALLAYNFERFS